MADARLMWQTPEGSHALDQTDEEETMEAPRRWRRSRTVAALVAAALGALTLALAVVSHPSLVRGRWPDQTGAMVSAAHDKARKALDVEVVEVTEGTTTGTPGETTATEEDEAAEGEATLSEIIKDTETQLKHLKKEIDRLTHAGEYDKISALALDVKKLQAFLDSQKSLLAMLHDAQEKLSAGDLEHVQTLVARMVDLKCLAENEAHIHELEKEAFQAEELGHFGNATSIMQEIQNLHDKCEKDSGERALEQIVLAN